MPKTYNVYSFLFPDGTRFVGLSAGIPTWNRGRNFKNTNKPLYDKIQECGWDHLQWNILLQTEDKAAAYQMRNEYRKKYKDQGIWFKERSSNKNVVEEVLHDFVAEMTAKLEELAFVDNLSIDGRETAYIDEIKDALLDCQSDVYHKHIKGGKGV